MDIQDGGLAGYVKIYYINYLNKEQKLIDYSGNKLFFYTFLYIL